MISKVEALNFNARSIGHRAQNTKAAAIPAAQNSTNLMGANYLQGLRAMNKISFKGTEELTPLEKSIIGDTEIRIPNILDIDETIDLSRTKMPRDKVALNAAGLNLHKVSQDNFDEYIISNDMGDALVIGTFDRTANLPTITYKQGKFMPEITVKDDSLGGKPVKMFAGSRLKGDGFDIIMPGSYEPIPGQKKIPVSGGQKDISFTGHSYTSILNKEDRTIYAYNRWYNSSLPSHAIKGDYADEMAAYDPNGVFLMGGFGERFKNMTRDKENKPSMKLPTDDNYRIMATTYNLWASAGMVKKDGTDRNVYLSQAHSVYPDKDTEIRYVTKYKTDGGAIAEALSRGIIRNDKDNVILNGDIFTNADITRAYHALKTLPDAALVIPYYPVTPERARSFGILGIEQDENNNLQIKTFIEKPKYTNNPPMPSEFKQSGDFDKAMAEYDHAQTATLPGNSNVYLANPGLYFISKEASKVLMAQGILDPDATGLGKDVMPKIVELCNQGKLKNEEGKTLKVYTVPLQAKGGKPAVWEDIGTAEAYLRLIKDVAYETKTHGTTQDNKYYGMPEFVLNDFLKNTDLKTGIVYGSQDSKEAFENFKTKYSVEVAVGNMFIPQS